MRFRLIVPALALYLALSGLEAQDFANRNPFELFGQGTSPEAEEGSAAPVPEDQEGGTSASKDTRGAPRQPSGPKIFGMELPLMDPGSEIMTWHGNSWQVVNNRLFGARFEKYLNAPAADSKEDQDYRDTLRAILDALSPHQPKKANVSQALNLLPTAAEYYHDARLCESLSNAIYGTWLARRNNSALRKANAKLEKQTKRELWNASMSASEKPLKTKPPGHSGGQRRKGEDERANGDSNSDLVAKAPDLESAIWISHHLENAAEYKAMAAKNNLSIVVSEAQQKSVFQGLIMQYFMQRRFEHVVIATRFYRLLFKDATAEFDEGATALKSFKTGFGMTPTATTFDALANETIRDVDEGVQAFEHLVEKGELASASKRLSEAFALGEHLPRIRILPKAKKEKVLEFVRCSNQLLSATDAKNYQLAGDLVQKLKGLAKDFDYARVESLINAATMTADMILDRALLAARRGDDDEMQKHIEKAHALYPTNPKLKKVSDLILKGSDKFSQALNDLDRLIAEGNYRAILSNQARFAAAVGLSDDPKRSEDLRKVQETLKELEMCIEKAKALVEAGNPEAAWETLHTGAEEFGKDPDFAQLYSKLTVKAARFVHMIEEATRHFENEQFGSSLSWYLKARQSYMKSELAARGIERIVKDLLPSEGGDTNL